MEIVYTLEAKEDIDYWKKSGNTARLKKIRNLLENILETPFEGIGKPEPLKYSLAGAWSGGSIVNTGLFTKFQGMR